MGPDVTIAITIVYSGTPREVVEVALQVEQGCTVAQVLQTEGLLATLSADTLPAVGLGIWGRRVPPGHVLREGDRLELYRALTVDPKVARRERFVRQGAKKAAGLFSQRRAGAKAGY